MDFNPKRVPDPTCGALVEGNEARICSGRSAPFCQVASLAGMATPYSAVAILLLCALCRTIQGSRGIPKDGSEAVRAFLDLLSADAADATSWEDFHFFPNPQLAFLGGLAHTPEKCKTRCNEEDFEGDECKGRFRSRCRAKFPTANGKVRATNVNTCIGTFQTHAVHGNGSFRGWNTCQGFRNRRDKVKVISGSE